MANQFEPYVDLKTAAEYLGVSEKTVRRMISDEKSPARREVVCRPHSHEKAALATLARAVSSI